MRGRSFRKAGVLLFVLLLAVVVGCQSIGGLNLNDMLIKQLDVNEQEQSQSFELELEFNDELLAKEDPEITSLLKAIQKLSLNITHSKVDDKGNQWVTGVLKLSKGDIPFTLHSDGKAIRFDVEGAKRPFVVELPDMGSMLFGSMGSEGDPQQQIMESVRQLIKNVASYFVNGLPNPPVITVDQVSSPVNGVSTKLTKVHAEIDGEQLGELIPVYLDNLVKDKEGFRGALRGMVQWVMELPPEMKRLFGGSELFEEDVDIDAIVEEGVNELFPILEEAQKELADIRNEEDWKKAFNKGINAKADLFVDDSLHLRKFQAELNIAPEIFADEEIPIKNIKILSSGEMWNVNGDVDVPAVQVPINALKLDGLNDMQAFQFVRVFEEDSVLYGILKNDFKIDDQSFELSDEWGIPFFVDSEGVAYVPIRATMDEFGVRLNVPSAKGEIRFYDQATEQSFLLRRGSAKAAVNGEAITLKHKIVTDGPIAYASAEDLFGLLRAEYKVTELDNGESILEVTRDL
ncbi:hypothetical protein [Cohnella cholangitidis]|uniref:Copper amine oxidase-like N-terminal domain-containing protein n=1 Tax=Cohnella cholangitidis TaxID=2598458 RepID=A0A7G5BVB8_9BACL|nr:hypothetical protein [Cohnella cholangitidis]QMV40902.1 hypothetical protein FPL14_06510 [Cohnella cholangitidis]